MGRSARLTTKPTSLSAQSLTLLQRARAGGRFRRLRLGRRAGRIPAILFLTTGCYRGRASGCAIRNWVRRTRVRRSRNRGRCGPREDRKTAPIVHLFSRRHTNGRTRGRSGAVSNRSAASRAESLRCAAGLGKAGESVLQRAWCSLGFCIVRRAVRT